MVEPIADPGDPTGQNPYETRSAQPHEPATGPHAVDDQTVGNETVGEQTARDQPAGEQVAAPAHARIVVGVDGSEPSLLALRWGARQAAMIGASLEAVIAWEMPSMYGTGMLPGIPEGFDLEASAEETLAQAIEAALPPEQAAAVGRQSVLGNPAQAILDRAEGAELIVVGVRGHGTFRSTLLGSVSHAVTLHAPCPVVVVRGKSAQAS